MVPEKFCNTHPPHPSHAAPHSPPPQPYRGFQKPSCPKPAGPATGSSLLIYLCSGCLTLVGKAALLGWWCCLWATSLHLPLHLLALSVWLRAPGCSGTAQIPRKHQHKCLKHLAGIYVTVPALGTFSLRHPRDVMQPINLKPSVFLSYMDF